MFRFTIRELVLLVLVAAMGLGWWVDRSRLAVDGGRSKEALMKMRRMGFWVGDLVGPEMQAELNATWEAEHSRPQRFSQRRSVR